VYEGYDLSNVLAKYSVVNEPFDYEVSLLGSDAAFFELDENLQLRFSTAVAFEDYADADGDNVFELVIRVDDLTNPETDQNITDYPVSVSLLTLSSGEEPGLTPEEEAEQIVIDSSELSRVLSEVFSALSTSAETAVASAGLTGVDAALLTYLGLPGITVDNVGSALAAYAKYDATATLAEFKDFAAKFSVLSRLTDPDLAKGVTVTDLVNAGLIPAGTTVDGLLMWKLRQIPLEQRDTVTELQGLVNSLK
jgi:hypothetical protein